MCLDSMGNYVLSMNHFVMVFARSHFKIKEVKL